MGSKVYNAEALRRAYSDQVRARQEIISENAARRMRTVRQPALPVPPKPVKPLVPVAYDADGGYYGRLSCEDECPEGCEVRMEPLI